MRKQKKFQQVVDIAALKMSKAGSDDSDGAESADDDEIPDPTPAWSPNPRGSKTLGKRAVEDLDTNSDEEDTRNVNHEYLFP